MSESKNELTAAKQEGKLVPKTFADELVLDVQEKEKFGLTFPEGYNYTNELMSAMYILQETTGKDKRPVLESCSRASIKNALLEMVTEGLSMQKKQCYPIAYGGKLQCQKSVYGNTCIARRYGMKHISSQVVYEGDDFDYEITDAEKHITKHKQKFENIDNDKIVGAYAVADMADGRKITEIMNMAQIKKAWEKGYGYKENAGVHKDFTDQMAMKTVKNRLLKQINNTYGTMEIDDIDTDDMPTYSDRIEADVAYDIETNANAEEFVISEDEVEVVDNAKDNAVPFMD